MLLEERLSQISQIVDKEGSATIDFLAQKLEVSKDTIRRDLIKLESRKKLHRVHGGAIPIGKEAEILNYEERSNISSNLKKKIASKIKNLIKDHRTLIFDSSTTVEAAIKQLDTLSISTITNSLTNAILLSKYDNATVQLLPGKLNKNQLFLYGAETVEKLSQYQVDFTILGVFTLSNNGLFIHTEEEGIVKRKMIQQGRKVIALADHTKLNKEGFFKICDLKEIDGSVAKFQNEYANLNLTPDYAGIPIRTLISVETEKPKSVPFLRFFLYIPRIVSMPLIVVEAVRRVR